MKSRVKGRYYEILESEDEIYPTVLNKKATDRKLAQLSAAMETIKNIIKDSYDDEDYSFYQFIRDNIFETADINCDDGRIWKLNESIDAIKEIQETLATHNDEIKPPEFRQTLEDLGYEKDIYSFHRKPYIWKKLMENSDLQEVTEEIIIDGSEFIRRIRTIKWEKVEGGRKSTSVTYKKLPIGKKLRKTIENTAEKLSK